MHTGPKARIQICNLDPKQGHSFILDAMIMKRKKGKRPKTYMSNCFAFSFGLNPWAAQLTQLLPLIDILQLGILKTNYIVKYEVNWRYVIIQIWNNASFKVNKCITWVTYFEYSSYRRNRITYTLVNTYTQCTNTRDMDITIIIRLRDRNVNINLRNR